MNIYITTSNDYVSLMPETASRLNKYWPDQDVTVLHFDVVPEGLPDNFKLHNLGNQADFGRSWTDPLLPFFSELQDEYFILLLDDYFLDKPVDQSRIDQAEVYVDSGASKFDLSGDRAKDRFIDHKDYIESSQWARYRTSLQAAIWRKDYFLKYLKPSRDIWQFEFIGYKEAFNDGALVLGSRDVIVSYENAVLKGEKS
jgi:hypothetical protein